MITDLPAGSIIKMRESGRWEFYKLVALDDGDIGLTGLGNDPVPAGTMVHQVVWKGKGSQSARIEVRRSYKLKKDLGFERLYEQEPDREPTISVLREGHPTRADLDGLMNILGGEMDDRDEMEAMLGGLLAEASGAAEEGVVAIGEAIFMAEAVVDGHLVLVSGSEGEYMTSVCGPGFSWTWMDPEPGADGLFNYTQPEGNPLEWDKDDFNNWARLALSKMHEESPCFCFVCQPVYRRVEV